jgi:hypothetical protein
MIINCKINRDIRLLLKKEIARDLNIHINNNTEFKQIMISDIGIISERLSQKVCSLIDNNYSNFYFYEEIKEKI